MPRSGIPALLLALVAPACVGVPLAAPPARLTLGTGVVGAKGEQPAVPISFRGALAPLGVVEALRDRLVDFTVGYLYDGTTFRRTNGVILEGSLVAARGRAGTADVRLRPALEGRWLWVDGPNGQETGPGAALKVTGELCWFTEGDSTSTSDSQGGLLGFAYGEFCAGLYGEGAVAAYPEKTIWSASGGVELRIPAVLAFVWTWVWATR